MRPAIIFITGVSGSGKTTLLNNLSLSLSEINIINYGEIMLDIFSSSDGMQHGIPKLQAAQQQEITNKLVQRILDTTQPITLIDAYALIDTPAGYYPGFSNELVNLLKPAAIAILEAPPEIILQRRQQGNPTLSKLPTEEEIEQHQLLNKSFVATFAANFGTAIIHINNIYEPISAGQQLSEMIKSVLPISHYWSS